MDSAVKANCPHCNVKLKWASRPADDKSLKCPSCKKPFFGSDLKLGSPKKTPVAPQSPTKASDNMPEKPSGRKSVPTSKVQPAKDEELDELEEFDEATDEEYDEDSDSIFEDHFENSDESDGWNDEEFEEAMPLPPSRKAASKSAKLPSRSEQSETSKSIPRRTIFIAAGGLLGLVGLITVLILVVSFATRSEYDKVYAEWYRLTYDYAKSQNANASSSENADTAKKMIESIQSKIMADGPINFLLPEAQRQPLKQWNPNSKLSAEEQKVELLDKEKIRKTLSGFGIALPPWLTPLSDGFQKDTLTPTQEKLFIGIVLQTVLTELG